MRYILYLIFILQYCYTVMPLVITTYYHKWAFILNLVSVCSAKTEHEIISDYVKSSSSNLTVLVSSFTILLDYIQDKFTLTFAEIVFILFIHYDGFFPIIILIIYLWRRGGDSIDLVVLIL